MLKLITDILQLPQDLRYQKTYSLWRQFVLATSTNFYITFPQSLKNKIFDPPFSRWMTLLKGTFRCFRQSSMRLSAFQVLLRKAGSRYHHLPTEDVDHQCLQSTQSCRRAERPVRFNISFSWDRIESDRNSLFEFHLQWLSLWGGYHNLNKPPRFSLN